jgi:hypothetical protein
MYTSLVLFALAGAPGAADTPTWVTDYQAARKESASIRKPIAVFLGRGEQGYNQVARGNLGSEAERLLSANYICCYIDTSTEEGRDLAQQFQMPGGQGIVISDRTGDLQAFRHPGTLSSTDLTAYLQRYADTNRVVTRTETVTSDRVSFFSGPGGPGGPDGSTMQRGYGPTDNRGYRTRGGRRGMRRR